MRERFSIVIVLIFGESILQYSGHKYEDSCHSDILVDVIVLYFG